MRRCSQPWASSTLPGTGSMAGMASSECLQATAEPIAAAGVQEPEPAASQGRARAGGRLSAGLLHGQPWARPRSTAPPAAAKGGPSHVHRADSLQDSPAGKKVFLE